jgi:hypothetical protein
VHGTRYQNVTRHALSFIGCMFRPLTVEVLHEQIAATVYFDVARSHKPQSLLESLSPCALVSFVFLLIHLFFVVDLFSPYN